MSSAPFARLEQQFVRVISPHAVASLHSRMQPNNLVITIGGDQCTGKSTLCYHLAARFGGRTLSAGSIFRAHAKRRGIPVSELSKIALNDPSIDVGIEYEMVESIAMGDSDGPLFVEGRQAGIMGCYVKEAMKKDKVIRLYLTCSLREQALRFLEREMGKEVAARAAELLPKMGFRSLSEIGAILRQLPIPEIDSCCRKFSDAETRDEDDRRRFQALYELPPQYDYRNPRVYDIVIDTTNNRAIDTFEQALAGLAKLGVVPPVQQPVTRSKL